MTLKGAADLDRKLAALGNVAASKVMRGAMRAAMNEAKKEAEGSVPVGTVTHRTYRGRLVAPGFAKRNLRVVVVRDKSGAPLRALLGVRREAFYAVQFLELGTSKMPANPWLVPAFERAQPAVTGKLIDGLRERIERAAKGRK